MQRGGREEEKAVRVFLAGNKVPEADGERKRADMDLFRQQVRRMPVCREKPLWIRVWEQAAFVHPVSWAVQILFLAGAVWMAERWGGEMAIMGISAMVPLFAVVGGFELSKAVFYHMWELERSCRYDTRKVAAMKLLLFGLCDLAALSAFSLLVYRESGDFMQICLLVLVPFNLSTGMYLLVLERFPIRSGNVILAGLGCMMSGVQMVFWNQWRRGDVRLESMTGWEILAVSLLFLAGMAVRFCREKDREDVILWNLD